MYYNDHGAATWPGEIDLARDALCTELQKVGGVGPVKSVRIANTEVKPFSPDGTPGAKCVGDF